MLTRIARPGGPARLVAMVLVLGSMVPAANAETVTELFERVHRSVVVIRSVETAVGLTQSSM